MTRVVAVAWTQLAVEAEAVQGIVMDICQHRRLTQGLLQALEERTRTSMQQHLQRPHHGLAQVVAATVAVAAAVAAAARAMRLEVGAVAVEVEEADTSTRAEHLVPLLHRQPHY